MNLHDPLVCGICPETTCAACRAADDAAAIAEALARPIRERRAAFARLAALAGVGPDELAEGMAEALAPSMARIAAIAAREVVNHG